jgi:hypothetical protein
MTDCVRAWLASERVLRPKGKLPEDSVSAVTCVYCNHDVTTRVRVCVCVVCADVMSSR